MAVLLEKDRPAELNSSILPLESWYRGYSQRKILDYDLHTYQKC